MASDCSVKLQEAKAMAPFIISITTIIVGLVVYNELPDGKSKF